MDDLYARCQHYKHFDESFSCLRKLKTVEKVSFDLASCQHVMEPISVKQGVQMKAYVRSNAYGYGCCLSIRGLCQSVVCGQTCNRNFPSPR